LTVPGHYSQDLGLLWRIKGYKIVERSLNGALITLKLQPVVQRPSSKLKVPFVFVFATIIWALK